MDQIITYLQNTVTITLRRVAWYLDIRLNFVVSQKTEIFNFNSVGT